MSELSNAKEIPGLEAIVEEAEDNPREDPKIRGERLLPTGVTESEELFCQEFARHRDVLRAVRAGGYKFKNNNVAYVRGNKIKSRERVQKRIDELIIQAARRNNVTVDTVVEMIRRTYDEAMAAKKFDAANTATKMLGEYLQVFNHARRVENVVNITHRHEVDKEIARLAKIAGVPLQITQVTDAQFSEVKNEDKGEGDHGVEQRRGGGDSPTAPGDIRVGDSAAEAGSSG